MSERVGQDLGIVGHEHERRFVERVQVHIHDLPAHGDRRGMWRVPLAPDAIGADVEKLHARLAVVARAQGLDKRAVMLEEERVGVVGFDARNFFPAAGGMAILDLVVKALAARVEQPLRRGVVAAAVRAARHHAQRHRRAARLPRGNGIIYELPIVYTLLRLGIHPREADINNRTRETLLAFRAAVPGHPAHAGIGQQRIHLAKRDALHLRAAGDEARQQRRDEKRQNMLHYHFFLFHHIAVFQGLEKVSRDFPSLGKHHARAEPRACSSSPCQDSPAAYPPFFMGELSSADQGATGNLAKGTTPSRSRPSP